MRSTSLWLKKLSATRLAGLGRPEYRRQLELHMESVDDRNSVFSAIAKSAHSFLPAGCFVRADMTPSQLQFDFSLRQHCRQCNLEPGRLRFYVRDLQIVDRDALRLN